ncbi:heterokaryon incompatibility protein-domain-containing protein, partial [Cercophora newfieldiana]
MPLWHLNLNKPSHQPSLPDLADQRAQLKVSKHTKMASPSPSPYFPLPSPTTIRVLLLAPASNPDDDIHAWLLPADLDQDHVAFPDTTERPMTWWYPFQCTPPSGTSRQYNLEVDCVLVPQPNSDLIALPRHPFQRYTALSYVWGSPDDPEYILLSGDPNGDKKGITIRFPVTRNLHAALRSLRMGCDFSGMMLWVDAVCINQTDYVEKEGQLKLMRRVYRQAEEVVAYLPMGDKDQENLAELLVTIQEAYEGFVEDREKGGVGGEGAEKGVEGVDTDGNDEEKREETDGPEIPFEGDEQNGGASENGNEEDKEGGEDGHYSVSESGAAGNNTSGELAAPAQKPDSDMSFYDALASAQQRLRKYNQSRPEARFIEDFGLPPTNSPLWTSWRRLFASPYFRRIWILQEFALAPKLKLRIGERVSFDVTALILARHYLQSSSGIKNGSYLGHSAPGDPPELGTDALAGVRGFDPMIIERAWGQIGFGGKKNSAEKGEKDESAETAEKVELYGWGKGERLVKKLGAARSFEATDERDKVYALMGLAVDGEDEAWGELAGLGEGSLDIPTWVPNWSDKVPPSGAATRDVPSKTTSIQLDHDNNHLHIPGTFADEIEILSDRDFVNPGARNSPGMKLEDFDNAFWQGALQVLEPLITRDTIAESIVEQVMKRLLEAITEGGDLFDVLVQEPDRDARARLRKGFDSYTKLKITLFLQKTDPGAHPPADFTPIDSPREMHSFIDQATQNAWSTRLCATKSGRIGLVPSRTEAGDQVVVFQGCHVAFVLRPDTSNQHDPQRYRLVGHAYICRQDGELHAYDTSEEAKHIIVLV